MKKVVKWIVIITGGLSLLLVGALLVIPFFVDIQACKPKIEERISRAAGRPFVIGGEIKLSLFPWAGLALSDLHIGNPSGFGDNDFIYIKSFDVSVKLIPLLSRDIQVKKFVVQGARFVLEKGKDGSCNWEEMGEGAKESPAASATLGKRGGDRTKERNIKGLPLKAFAVGEFAITDSSILWIDHTTGTRRDISEINVHVRDMSLDRPVRVSISSMMDNRPFCLTGEFGPLGLDPGKRRIPFSFKVQALKELRMTMKGRVAKVFDRPEFDCLIDINPFSLQKVISSLGEKVAVPVSDPAVLNRISINAHVKGNTRAISVTDGSLSFDESKVDFSISAEDFKRPDINFDINLDKIDLDRYFPPFTGKGSSPVKEHGAGGETVKKVKKTDYAPMRDLLLKGSVSVGDLILHGARLQDINITVDGRNGIFRMEPVTLNAYHGSISAKATVDISRTVPESSIEIKSKGVEVRPLVKEVSGKDLLEGKIDMDASFNMVGDNPEKIIPALNGKGKVFLRDGAILGIDLAGMIQNIKAAFAEHAKKREISSKTEFSELKSVFTISDGILDTQDTALISHHLRVVAIGKADLVRQSLDFRVEPKYISRAEKGEEKKKQKTMTVPVLISGSFSSPEFRPDLEGAVIKGVEKALSDQSRLDKLLDQETGKKERKKILKDTVKDFLDGFISGDQ